MTNLRTLLAARRILYTWTGDRIRELRQHYGGRYVGVSMGKRPDTGPTIVNQLENETRRVSLDEAIALERLERQRARENKQR